MKKIILLFSILCGSILTFLTYSLTPPNTAQKTPLVSHAQIYLFDAEGHPKQALLELLTLLNVQHDGTLANIVSATQAAWLRKPGTERWHIEEMHADKKTKLLELLNQIGCIQALKPTQQTYDYAIILGATVFRVRTRLAYLLQQWEQGVRFKQLVFLGAERILDPKVEPQELLIHPTQQDFPYLNPQWHFNGQLPKTEHEMIKMVFEQTALPEGFDQVEVIFINTPMQSNLDGSLRRPNSGDTINAWLATAPYPGSCLFVSNQPYISYQETVVRTFLPHDFVIETIGEASNENEKASVYLDNIARWLYQEQQLMMGK